MVWLATIAIIVGSFYAIFHTNYRKIIAFIVVAEIGYIGGIWTGHPDSILAAIYHILADSLMTLSLFMIAGMILFYLKSETITDCGNMFRRLPVTSIALIIVFASIVGIPPTSGFFTKLYLIKRAFQMGQFQFILALLFSSLTALFIFFRLFESYLWKKNDNLDASTRIKESRLLAIPLIGVSTGILVLGLTFNFGTNIF